MNVYTLQRRGQATPEESVLLMIDVKKHPCLGLKQLAACNLNPSDVFGFLEQRLKANFRNSVATQCETDS